MIDEHHRHGTQAHDHSGHTHDAGHATARATPRSPLLQRTRPRRHIRTRYIQKCAAMHRAAARSATHLMDDWNRQRRRTHLDLAVEHP